MCSASAAVLQHAREAAEACLPWLVSAHRIRGWAGKRSLMTDMLLLCVGAAIVLAASRPWHPVHANHVTTGGSAAFHQSFCKHRTCSMQVSVANISATAGDVQPVVDFIHSCLPP